MKHFFLKYWWIFPMALGVFMFSLAALFTTWLPVLEDIVAILLMVTIIALVVSWVILLINKKWWQCLTSITGSIMVVCLLWFPLVIGAMHGPYHDGFGKKHKIPEGLEYHLPLGYTDENGRKDLFNFPGDTLDVAEIDSLNPDTYLQIWNDFQGGRYIYSFYYGPLPQGEIFLRCYEVTKNVPLSEHEIAERSNVKIGTTHTFRQLVYKKGFTIYEGDWEDYYAARIEVWHKNASSGEETKLLEKIYRVEGWMR